MRFSLLTLALGFSLPFAAAALADEQTDKLVALCKANETNKDSCECQAKAIIENADPRYLKVLLAIADVGPNGDMSSAMPKAMADAGLTQDEYKKLADEQDAKISPLVDACKK